MLVFCIKSSDYPFLLYNAGTSDQPLQFTLGEKSTHPRIYRGSTGGGDWNNDGIIDLVKRRDSRTAWSLHPGKLSNDGKHTFSETAEFVIDHPKYKLKNHDKYVIPKHYKGRYPDGARWFDRTPYAWNFSGANPHRSKVSEIVAVMNAPENAERAKIKELGGIYNCNLGDINYYTLNHETRECVFRGTLARINTYAARLSIGDLNADGSMDIVCTGGVFRSFKSKIWVLYGKVQNVPERPKHRRWFVSRSKAPAKDWWSVSSMPSPIANGLQGPEDEPLPPEAVVR